MLKAQHACTLWPTFSMRGLHHPTATKTQKLWIVSGAGLFFSFSFFSMGIGKQTDAELAVRQRHGAGRAAVSSHDPSVTQSD